MKKMWKCGAAFVLALTMVFGCAAGAYADTEGEVTVDEGDKLFISFGADLRKDEKAKVLSLMGLKEEDLNDYDVIEITNDEEHEYLGEYIPADTIGYRALSSVVVMEGEKGSGIHVTTKNINYCTEGMYENALATAGVEDAEVIVAGPFKISGTAALLGSIRAYSVMSGEEVDEEVIDGAINEIVITGSLEDETGSTEEIEGMVAYLKDQVAGENLSEKELQTTIEDAAEQFDVQLSQEQIDELIALLDKLQGLDLDWDKISKQAQNVYDRLKELGFDIDPDALAKEAQGFFARLIEFFKNLFHR